MAYRRTLAVRARVYAQKRFTPSISYLNHHDDRKNQHSDRKLNSFIQSKSYGVYGNNTITSLGLGFRNSKWSQFGTVASGFLLARNMSTTIPDVLADKAMEVVSNQAAPVVSEVAAAAANSSFPVAALQYAIDGIHTFTGLNWWASLAITTIIIRTLLLPITINQQKVLAKINILKRKSEDITQEMLDKGASVAEIQKEKHRLITEGIISVSEVMTGGLIVGTFIVSYLLAIQNMMEKVPSLKTGGASWFLDLTTADNFYILPCLNAYAFWIYSECYVPAGKEKNNLRFLVALSVPFIASFSQAFFCFWLPSNLFFLVYKLIIKQEPVQKFLNIPSIVLPPPSDTSETKAASESKSDSSD